MSPAELMERTWGVLAATPGEGKILEYPTQLAGAIGIYARSRSLFYAATILVREQFPEEAMVLGRSLFEESLWLYSFAEKDGRSRDAEVLGSTFRALGDEMRLIEARAAEGMSPRGEELLEAYRAEFRQLQGLQKRLEIGKTTKPGDPKPIAKRAGLESEHWDFLWSHRITHGSSLAHRLRRRKWRAITRSPSSSSRAIRSSSPAWPVSCARWRSSLTGARASCSVGRRARRWTSS
jgi:hypothetical protein